MLDKVTWPVVALIGIVLSGIVVLTAFHADTAVIVQVITLLFLGGGAGILHGVRTNVNGNLARLISVVEQALTALAQSQPPTPPTEEQSGG